MPIDLMLIFQGVASFSAMIQAAKSALDISSITKQKLLETVKDAEFKAAKEIKPTHESKELVSSISDYEKELINRKIKEAKERWYEAVANSEDQADWAEATDRSKSDQCALLRIAKQLNRGVLPKEWYKDWADLGCS